MNPLGIIFEMTYPIPFVWLVLFLGRRRFFPDAQKEDARSRKRVTPFIIGAILLGIFGRTLTRNFDSIDTPLEVLLFLIFLSAITSFLMIYGCANYSFKKGYHWGWGFLGVFSLLGLLIIALFKSSEKRHAETKEGTEQSQ